MPHRPGQTATCSSSPRIDHRGAQERHVVLVADELANPADVQVERADVARVAHPPVDALPVGRHELLRADE